MTKIGFIGLGVMGEPMAAHLLAQGHSLFTFKRHGPLQQTLAGAVSCESPADVARHADVIITMLPDTPDVEAVLFGGNGLDGVANGLTAGKTVIDMSSIDPLQTKVFAARIRALDCHYLDAPVSGGEVGAKAATLTIMVGGDEAAFARVKELFDAMGKNVTLVGDAGAGQTCKIANQIIVALTIEAVSEALVFASKAGADPAKVREALMGGFASSRILEVHGQRMIGRTFAPGFRSQLHQKDLRLALDSARALGVALPNTASCAQLFSVIAAQGDASLDHSALIKAIETMSNHALG